jgi:hypothetical protein
MLLLTKGWMKTGEVRIYGLTSNMEKYKVEAIVNRELAVGYLAVDLAKLASEFTTVNFVRSARIVRKIPKNLDIYLESQIPIASWTLNDETSPRPGLNSPHTVAEATPNLVNQAAEIFVAAVDGSLRLPRLSSHETGSAFQDELFRKAMVDRLLRWQSWAHQLGIAGKITGINITPALMWEVQWNDQMVVNLGAWQSRKTSDNTTTNDNLLQNEEWLVDDLIFLDKRMHRFLNALSTLQKNYGTSAMSVDMRYPFAMAVRPSAVTTNNEQ